MTATCEAEPAARRPKRGKLPEWFYSRTLEQQRSLLGQDWIHRQLTVGAIANERRGLHQRFRARNTAVRRLQTHCQCRACKSGGRTDPDYPPQHGRQPRDPWPAYYVSQVRDRDIQFSISFECRLEREWIDPELLDEILKLRDYRERIGAAIVGRGNAKARKELSE